MEVPENFRVVVKGLVYRHGKVLIIRRSQLDPHAGGKWEIPGGKIEWGEDPTDVFKREVLEETSLEVTGIKPLLLTSFETPGRFVVGIIFQSNYVSGDVKISDEHEDFKWIELKDIGEYDFHGWIKEELKKFSE